MLRKLRQCLPVRRFASADKSKVGIFAPLNTFVLQESLYLLNVSPAQRLLLQNLQIEDLITAHVPSSLQHLSAFPANGHDSLKSLSAEYQEVWKQAVQEVQQFRAEHAAKASADPSTAGSAPPEESRLSKKYPQFSSKMALVPQKPVCFDPIFHTGPSSPEQLPFSPNAPGDLERIVSGKVAASISKVDFIEVSEEHLKNINSTFAGRPEEFLDNELCRLAGFGVVRVLRELRPDSLRLQEYFRNSLLEKLDTHRSHVTSLTRINPLQSGASDIQDNLQSIKARLEQGNLDEVLGPEERLWELLLGRGFSAVEYETVADNHRLIANFKEHEFEHLVDVLGVISQSLRGVSQKKTLPKNLTPDSGSLTERTAAATYFNSLLAYLRANFVLSATDVFFLTNEPDFLVRAAFLSRVIRKFCRDYIESWSHTENSYFMNNDPARKAEEETRQREEFGDLMRRYSEEGSPASKRNLVDRVTKLLKSTKLSDAVRSAVTEELGRFSELSEHDSDYHNLKNYLELILKMPFGRFSVDQKNLQKAAKVLDDSHFGMEDIKKRILQFLAVGRTKGSLINKKIICLLGPPGVGKTSVSKAIADCLGRKFVRVSLGGENDVSVIKGHRRTYIGAYPGKIVNALKMAGTENPVILLDEIDKVSQHGYKGNIQDVLLEILDPAQNHAFYDHYLDLPVDLSKVLFLCSANVLDSSTVTPALYDRMEVIELSGYTTAEKISIFERHLLPKAVAKMGFDKCGVRVDFPPATIHQLISDYAREPGVRNLEKHLIKIFEKIAFDFFRNNQATLLQAAAEATTPPEGTPDAAQTPAPRPETVYTVEAPMVREFLGPKRFFSQTIFHEKEDLIGFAFGLGYSAYGGSVLSIEVLEVPSAAPDASSRDFLSNIQNITISRPREPSGTAENEVGVPENAKTDGSLLATGSLGAVMKESVEIAYSFAKFFLYKVNRDASFLESRNLHIHFPEGASKKDGPSAGITIVSALISAATRTPFNPQFAMTGEISLNGKVLKIGGLKEKVLAAKREGIPNIICPKANAREVEEMKEDVREGVTFHFVENYDEVYHLLFDPASNEPQ